MKIQLTVVQSAKLIELGVSRSKANGIWLSHVMEVRPYTLADILDILPKEICNGYSWLNMRADNIEWTAEYLCHDEYGHVEIDEDASFDSPELIDALYSLLLWCLEKGYVK